MPSLDACKKISNWINNPSSAIWMATLASHMVLSQNKMTAKSFFIGNSEADYKAAIKSNIKPYIINNKILSDKIGQKRSFSSLHQVIKYLIK